MKILKNSLFAMFIAAIFISCNDLSDENQIKIPDPEPEFVSLQLGQSKSINSRKAPGKLAIYSAEYLTDGTNNRMGNIIYFNDRGNKQLDADFVPGQSFDDTDDISYYVDNNRSLQNFNTSVTEAAIDRAMNTWDNITCSELGMYKIPYDGRTTGFFTAILGELGLPFTGSFDYVADVVHAGWLPRSFFDFIFPEDGGDYVLGVAITIIFVNEEDEPLDSNNDGKIDVAWREIYYNENISWNDGANIDIETTALHEAGHGLSQAHFGKAFTTLANDKLHFAPRAVMNAGYSGVLTTIEETDNAGHCSLWSSWPNR